MKILDWLKSEETLKKEKRVEKENEYRNDINSLIREKLYKFVVVPSTYYREYFTEGYLQRHRIEIKLANISEIFTRLSNFLESLKIETTDIIFFYYDSSNDPFRLTFDKQYISYDVYSFIFNFSIVDKNGKNKELNSILENKNNQNVVEFLKKKENKNAELDSILFINDKLVKALKENDSKRIEMVRELLNISIKNMLNKNNK